MNDFKAKLVLGLSAAFIFSSVNAATPKINGQEAYEKKCAVCHAEGKGNAPKLDDKSYWKARLEKGVDHMFQQVVSHEHHVSCYKCSHREVKEAVKYMATQTGGGNKTLW